MQEAGQAIYLVAWRGDELAGQCTVLTTSKYEEVRQLLGALPEMNALEARPPGQGTGTKIIACAEHTARQHGAAMIGLAVAVSNDGAHRLYQRLGYKDGGQGLVVGPLGRNRFRRHSPEDERRPLLLPDQVDRVRPGRATNALVMPFLV